MHAHFIHVGDLHLEAGPTMSDRLNALQQVIEAGRREPIDAWLFPGDLTHSGTSIETRNLLLDAVSEMADHAPVFIVDGNHDPKGDLRYLSKIDCCTVITEPRVTIAMSARGKTLAVFGLPYPSKAKLVAAGVPNDQIAQAASNAFELLLTPAAEELKLLSRRDGIVPVVIGHINVAGSLASVGQPQIGKEIELSVGHLHAFQSGTYIGLNHIHKQQLLGPARYAGSICRLDWGEVEEKGFVDVVYKNGYAMPTFVPINVPPMYHVEGVLTRESFEWAVTRGPDGARDDAPASWAGCDVRVRARYAQSEREVLNDARQRAEAIFVGARRLLFEPMPVSDRVLRAPEVVTAQTFDEKLAAWARLMNVAWTQTMTDCAERLQSEQDVDALVADVGARLTRHEQEVLR